MPLARFRALLDAWINGQVPADVLTDDVPRARVFLVTAWLALFLGAFTALAAVRSGLPTLVAITTLDALVAGLVLVLFCRPSPVWRRRAVKLFLGFFTCSLSAGMLAVTPVDPTVLCFLFIVPLVGALMEGEEAGLKWFLRPMAASAVVLVAGHLGYGSTQLDPYPLFTHLINVLGAFTCAMALLLALSRDRDRAIERIREVERARTAFFANVGHDIRTPMNGVLGMADVLLAEPLTPPQHAMVEVIRSSGDVLLRLIDDVLDLSRLEGGQLVLRNEPVALRPLLDELTRLWAPAAKKKQLAFLTHVDPTVPVVVSLDGVRVRQVLHNLLNNAVKFTASGSISLSLSVAAGQLCFVVEDTGLGIGPADQARLFTRFSHPDDARARRDQGSGLGLALSRELAQHMGGGLELSSRNDVPTGAIGSRFCCTLPLVPVEATVPHGAQARLPPGLKVLVVDDNSVNRLVAQRLLDRNGCRVHCAEGGRAALAATEGSSFDVVLMDVHMPEMDGLETTRLIRARVGGGVCIIGVSASAADADVDRCHEAGMNGFLAKPVTQERLIAAMLRLL